MKLFVLIAFTFLQASMSFAQRSFCADSSFRIKYIFGIKGAVLVNNPDTASSNLFTGSFSDNNIYGGQGIAVLRTNWGDSILWAKKYYLTGVGYCLNSFNSLNHAIILTGKWYQPGPSSHSELLIARIDTNGNVFWMKHFKLSSNHNQYTGGNTQTNNITLANNAIYINAIMNDNSFGNYNIIAKLDMDGNILWSRRFVDTSFNAQAYLIDPVVFSNGHLVFTAQVNIPGPIVNTSRSSVILTKLDDNDGHVIESTSYKSLVDSLDFISRLFRANPDSTFTLTGNLGVYLPPAFSGQGQSSWIFNSLFDANVNLVHNYFYQHNYVLNSEGQYYNFNNIKEHTVLSDNQAGSNFRYFITFGKNDEILRTRKFLCTSNPSGGTSVNLDDKQNLHFLFHYPENNQFVTEYARISNFAPSGTLGCFGKDTAILTTHTLPLLKMPFAWDIVSSDVIVSNPVIYNVQPANVTKQVVCKLVSYCDSVHINGPSTTCINTPVRFTVTKNSACLKNLEWVIDTTVATIVSTEGDSAITLSFIHPFSGYIHAVISNCVVGDSLHVSTIPAPVVHLINPDTLLCPGRAIALKATPGFRSYLWQDGRAGAIYNTDSAGFYKVSATDVCGFITSDSVTIKKSDNSLVVPTSQTVCLNDTAFVPLPNDLNNITWSPTTSSLLSNNTLKLFPRTSTTYTINAFRMANCIITRSTSVKVNICPETVYIPNSFSPNNDGLNDNFMAVVSRPLSYFSFSIYNRFGQEIFHTRNPNIGWNGTYNSKPQPIGVYPYQCFYRFPGKIERSVIGTITLVR